jgi:DNA polymerase-3 subunit delta'
MSTPALVPQWLDEAARKLKHAHASGRFPHALLLHESPGAGGRWLATWTMRLLQCVGKEPAPCGQCVGCARVDAGQHPDCLAVEPVEESKQIRIEQVRELARELTLTSHGGGWKIGLLIPADAMNVNAANALLKTLEEPAPRTLLILVATQPSRLPSTIASRCQRVRVRAPSIDQCLAWLRGGREEWRAALEVLGTAPFLLERLDPRTIAELRAETERGLSDALGGTLDAAATAERWGRSEYELRLRCIENWLTVRVRARAARAAHAGEMRTSAHLSESASDLNIRTLFELVDEVRELRALADTPLNRTLALEKLLWRIPTARHRGPPGRTLEKGTLRS